MRKKDNRVNECSTKNKLHPEIMPGLSDIYTMAYQVLNSLPKRFQHHTKNLIIRVENFADEATLQSLKVEDKYDLLGLYRGVPLPLKRESHILSLPDVIFLFRCPLIHFSKENKQDIKILIQHVMIHEMGHHFGYSDFDMEWIEESDGGRNRD